MYSIYGELLSLANIGSAVDQLFRAYLDAKLLELADAAEVAKAKLAKEKVTAQSAAETQQSAPDDQKAEATKNKATADENVKNADTEAGAAIQKQEEAATELTTAKNNKEGCDYWLLVESFRRDNLDPFTLYKPDPVLSKENLKTAQARLSADTEGKFSHAQSYLYWFDVRASFWEGKRIDKNLRELFTPSAILLQLEQNAQLLKDRLAMVGKSGMITGDLAVVYTQSAAATATTQTGATTSKAMLDT